MELALKTVLTFSGRAVWLVGYTVAGAACVGLAVLGPLLFKLLVICPYKSYFKYLPGPKSRGYLACDIGIICDTETSKEYNERLIRKYGRNIRVQGFGSMDPRLVTYDPVALNYILNQECDRYPKPMPMRRIISKLTGGDFTQKAVSVAEGPYHHRLRKIIAPAFAPATVKSHAPVFIRKAGEVCDYWRSVLSEPTAPVAPGVETDAKGATILDVNNWFGRAAFDVIGLAAFGYSFDALRDDTNELFSAYMRLHNATRAGPTLRTNISVCYPWLEPYLQDEVSRASTAAAKVIQATSKMLLQQRRVLTPEGDNKSILGLLLRSNASAAPEERLTDEELLAQIDTFMFAGADSTALMVTWALWELARHPEIQSALRAELKQLGLHEHAEQHEFGSDSGIDFDLGPSDAVAQFSAIDALPLLDRVLRETLRLHPPAHSSIRVAAEDDIIPISLDTLPKMADGSVSRAVVTGVGADGVERTGIRVRKSEFIHVPYEPMNTNRDVWGEDGHDFNPDRWLDLPPAAKNGIGLVSGLMTFSVGPHSCPASRFAMAEVKTMLAYVVSSFSFEETVKVLANNTMVTRPYVDDEWEKGFRLPLRVRAL